MLKVLYVSEFVEELVFVLLNVQQLELDLIHLL